MIEGDVRKLVGGVMSAGDSGSLKERLDRISALDHAVAMFQAKRATLARARKQVRAIMRGDATGTVIADLPPSRPWRAGRRWTTRPDAGGATATSVRSGS
jgi:hypothetical protein